MVDFLVISVIFVVISALFDPLITQPKWERRQLRGVCVRRDDGQRGEGGGMVYLYIHTVLYIHTIQLLYLPLTIHISTYINILHTYHTFIFFSTVVGGWWLAICIGAVGDGLMDDGE